MKKKYLNISILIFQITLSILLAVYLIVPVYDLSPEKLWGKEVHSPYNAWKQSPITQVTIKNNELQGIDSPSLQLFPFKGIENISVLDSVAPSSYNPFLLGKSIDDIQFLLKKNQKSLLVYNASFEKESFDQSSLMAIDVLGINDPRSLFILDNHLNMGHSISIMAGESDSLFCYNQVLCESKTNKAIVRSFQEGRNLLLLSAKDLSENNIEKLPVIRQVKWNDPELYLDLSEIGRIQIITSDYHLDTLSQSIKIKLPNVSWFRFQIDFGAEGFHYISNPFFRYNDQAFERKAIKANNQLTIFMNLSWLIGIILLNILINTIRKRFI